jgi:predicted Zn-dependent protease
MFVIAIGIAALFLQPPADVPVDAAWLGIWIVAGLPTGFALLWAAGGKQEVLIIDGSRLTLRRRAFVFARSRVLDAFAVRGLRVGRPTERTSNRRAIRQFWTDDAGSVQFDCEGRTYGFGVTMTEAEATNIVAGIATRFPYTTAVIPDPEVVEGPPRWRRWALAYVSFMLFVPITIPIRILVQDRETCFGGQAEAPENPVEISSLRAVGRVLLVPIDEFPTETADAVAGHYRRELKTPVDVMPALTAPPDAYDPVRRQSSATALIANLERLDVSSERIVIGLTESDMYIPGVNWRYAFSFRRDGRFAIVSTARMHRGCLGLMRASKDLQMKRLRKMVGKNIGVMYYRLPLSRDRRSLMYAYVGGPQELDGMSERY